MLKKHFHSQGLKDLEIYKEAQFLPSQMKIIDVKQDNSNKIHLSKSDSVSVETSSYFYIRALLKDKESLKQRSTRSNN